MGRREERCLFADRGFDFTYVALAFLDNDRIAGLDRCWDYGEDRDRLLGFCAQHRQTPPRSVHYCPPTATTVGAGTCPE